MTPALFAVKTAPSLALGGKTLQIAALAIEAVLAPVFLGIGGDWLDRRLGSTPYLLLGGLGMGAVVCAGLLREVNRRLNKDDAKSSTKDESR